MAAQLPASNIQGRTDFDNSDLEKGEAKTAQNGQDSAQTSTTGPPETNNEGDGNAAPKQLGAVDMTGWDGPDDPDHPLNWPRTKRYMQVIIVAVYTLVANLAATLFAPGAGQVAEEFGITNSVVVSLTVSIYVLGFSLGPLILAPLSELWGRLPVYFGSAMVYIAFIFGCAFATNAESFIVFRFLGGCAGAAPMALAGGTLADVIPPQGRAKWMSLFVAGPLLGPVIGPIAGGFITQSVGWRWDFRVILIAAGVVAILAIFYMRETYAPVVLHRRAERRKKHSGGAGIPSPAQKTSVMRRLGHDMTRPIRLLIFSPIVLFLSVYAAFAFGLMFLLFTTFTSVYEQQYGFATNMTGLTYLGLGLGIFIGLFMQSYLSQKLVDVLGAKRGSRRPEDRLAFMAYVSPVLPVGLFWYGWSTQSKTHWIVPILGTAPVGFGFVCNLMPQMIYLVEVYGAHAGASALAANTVFRSLAGSLLPLAGPAMYDKLGLGWGNSLLGFLAIAFIPVPWVLFLYGDRIRTRQKFDV